MFSSTFLIKHDGVGRSKSLNNLKNSSKPDKQPVVKSLFGIALILAGCLIYFGLSIPSIWGSDTSSKEAAARCSAKLKKLEDFMTQKKKSRQQKTQFTEQEVNAYLASNIGSKYHPSLKSLVVSFAEEEIQGTATVDFDLIDDASTKLFPKFLSLLFSGTHTISSQGKLISNEGKATFLLNQARFDNSTLPKNLIEGLITMIGKKQSPPFDPLKPSELPYKIERVDLKNGYIIVYQ
jgi:hypothetical protein